MKINSSIYNSFTANLNGCDTVMYILSLDSSNSRKVIGYNDDYNGTGDFNWGRASRVKQYYNADNVPKCIFVSSYASSSSGTADIYAMCEGTYTNLSMLPNFKSDDSIVSDPYHSNYSLAYNCISYSGGITSEWINPQMTYYGGSLTPWYNEDNVVALDNYYGNNPPRYAGATTYEVTTNESDAVVNVYKNGDLWTHASVRKPANNQLHGYAWESKLGFNVRVFHALNSLDYDNPNTIQAYGHIERRYRIADDQSTNTVSTHALSTTSSEEISFDVSAELGLTKVQDISISNTESDYLKERIKKLNNEVIYTYNELYNNWVNRIMNDSMLSLMSNSIYFTQTTEYQTLRNYIKNNKCLVYLIIEQYLNEEPNIFSLTLFNDNVVENNPKTLELANSIRIANNKISYQSLNTSTYIAPTFKTNALCFIKEVLNEENKMLLE